IKTYAGVRNSQLNLLPYFPEVYVKFPHTTMFHAIEQRFLRHAEQAKRNFLREGAGNGIAREFDIHFLSLGKLLAKASDCRSKSKVLEFRGVQAVRYGLNVRSNLG